MDDVVLFRTHKFNPRIDKNLKHLTKSKKQVEVLFDNTNGVNYPNAFNIGYKDLKASGLPLASVSQLYKCFIQRHTKVLWQRFPNEVVQQLWYNVGHFLILYYLENPDKEYYWSVEYDVYFNGNWDNFFDIYKRYKTDYLGVHIQETHLDNNNGVWGLFDFNVPYKRRFRCFGTIQRISNRLMKAVYEELLKGNHTYFEQIFPSVAMHYGYSVKDLNEIALKKIDKPIYTSDTMRYKDFTLDKMVHTPNGYDKLFHPLR